MKIILASKSPRRKELLSQVGYTYECVVSEKEENTDAVQPSDVVKELSQQKAEDVCAKIEKEGQMEEDCLVIGADTIVAKDSEIFGKPKDTEDARRMLSALQGREHSVWTGVTLIYLRDGKKKKKVFAEETKVHMYSMSEQEIEEYIRTKEPEDKAGAYAIQGYAAKFIKKIDGDYNNVVGLPVARIYQELKKLTKEDSTVLQVQQTEDLMPDVKWYDKAVFYHIYPLGLCGCAHENTGVPEEHFDKLNEWAVHAGNIGCTAIYIGPLFESVGHGYETTDYKMVDRRLGTNDDFKKFVENCHNNGIKVVVDGVFNHTGRGFFAFKDLKENRENSRYKDWYCNVNFGENNEYNDGFSYENWGGYNLLAKLNVWNPEVKNYLFDVVRFWISEFDIDGIRLDAADVLDMGFMSELRQVTMQAKEDFWLMGEVIHGDYSRWANNDRLNSVTNYELHKGLYSGHNDHNYFEIAHTINRLNQLAQGIKLYTFTDNHDVARIHSKLNNKEHIYDVTMLLYTVPGIPSIYYGSEFAIDGNKENGSDWNLRPCLELDDFDEDTELLNLIRRLGILKKAYRELTEGTYEQLMLTNRQFAFARKCQDSAVITALNNDEQPASFELPLMYSNASVQILAGPEEGAQVKVQDGKIKIQLPADRGVILHVKA
ncbi:alpha amylase catalytic domain protein [Roseburia sp. CAG:303]|nr:alpha amylase catalytic domain protein [Roseburia sp. CAG:303]